MVLKETIPVVYEIAQAKDASTADLTEVSNGSLETEKWNASFSITAQHWEVEAVAEFFNLLYSSRQTVGGVDKILWSPKIEKAYT